MKRPITIIAFACLAWGTMIGTAQAQTNTFPSSGSVGLGTLSPSEMLHIVNGRLKFSGTPSGGWLGSGWSSTGTDGLTIDQNGNVGIGTSSPNKPLHVHNSNYPQIQVSDETDNGWIGFNAPDMMMWNHDTGGNILFRFGSGSGIERLRITYGGDVCDQGTDADLSDCSSDVRLKQNIAPYDYGLKEIMQLRPVHFNWNGDAEKLGYDPGIKVTGLVAQEVEDVIPDWVSLNGEGFKKIDGIGDLRYAFINAIKEQQNQIEKLSSQTTEQQKLLMRFQKRIEELEQKLDSLNKQ